MAVAPPGSLAAPVRRLSGSQQLWAPQQPWVSMQTWDLPGERCQHPATHVGPKPGDTGDNCSLQHLGFSQLALKGLQMVQSRW